MSYVNRPSHAYGTSAPINVHAIPQLAGEILQALVASSIDPAIAVLALLSCISLLTQGVADVLWPNGIASPIGISGYLVAPSGAGKSLTLRMLIGPIERYLDVLARTGHKRVIEPAFFIEDATRQAVVEHLIDWPIAGLITDEAGQLQNLLSQGAPTLAKLLDGATIRHARVGSGRVALVNKRLVVLAMSQPNVFEAHKKSLGVGTGGVGLANRVLFGQAHSSPYGPARVTTGLNVITRSRFEDRVVTLLDKTIENVTTQKPRTKIRLAESALRRFTEIQVEVAAGISYHPPETREYVSRHAERTLRTAAALHVFHHGVELDVQLESLEAAHLICLWSTASYKDLIVAPPARTQAELDAEVLEDALNKVAGHMGPNLDLAYLRRMSPNIGLTPGRFDRALPLLRKSGKITLHMQSRGKTLIFVNQPALNYLLPSARF